MKKNKEDKKEPTIGPNSFVDFAKAIKANEEALKFPGISLSMMDSAAKGFTGSNLLAASMMAKAIGYPGSIAQGINPAFFNIAQRTRLGQGGLIAGVDSIGLPLSDFLKSSDKKLKIQSDITILEQKYISEIRNLEEKNDYSENEVKRVTTLLTGIKEEIEAKKEVANILPRIHLTAGEIILKNEEFKSQFTNNKKAEAVVVSIDIRRSTELMLKAKSHEGYSQFITDLTAKLSGIIIANFGIFDKFTGDGVLAFFPSFYSGADAIVHAIRASESCHREFEEHYREHRSLFNVFLTNIGLGIGIDYGDVSIVNNDRELTVVGIPVVYACRFSGTEAGTTVLNGNAFDYLTSRHPRLFKHKVVAIDLKHEGPANVFMVELTEEVFDKAELPSWLEDSASENEEKKEAIPEENQQQEPTNIP